ncbi:hypothetical protein A4D02_13540 [Niastella koreensis]|uniref:Uncharacterized protein n=2 Tax=Niastella koreensis TaxID=354356 RepID=G8TNQ1_NIAKG|nr:hypothetical protein [Niastella koreensis]AEW00977.1 hypothetical protein Niako_4721 [Niastella koreensis GR20-10]OQP42583.1 hypothetical protein A4D02_13540 [Niastella koreensis]
MTLLRLENNTNLLFFFLGIGVLILLLLILRWAVRINNIARNQRVIIYLMKHQFIKNGATPEELNAIEKGIEHIMNG